MDINKVHWSSEGNNLRLTMPLTKINEEKRQVSGWATLDSIDQQGDVILADASSRAFQRFRGNVREMHQPIAVGRMVDFKEDDYIDENGQAYRGVFVTAHVSRGAQDTWEKVLDGTLTGFSLGGDIIEDAKEFVKDVNGGRVVRFIKDYNLNELSLVDAPCNQHANLVSIEKMSDGSTTITGDSVDVAIENILYCAKDGITVATTDESRKCFKCNGEMSNIGWVETSDPDKITKMEKAVESSKFASNNNSSIMNTGTTTSGGGYTIVINTDSMTSTDIATTIANTLKKQDLNGGVNVAEKDKQADEAVEAATGAVAAENDEPSRDAADDKASQENVKATADNSEVSTDADNKPVEEDNVEAGTGVDADNAEVAPGDDLEKMVTSLHETIDKAFAKNAEVATEAIATVQSSVEKLSKSFDEKVSEWTEKFDSLKTTVDELGGTVATVKKSVETVEDSTGIKKSGDVEPSDTTIKKSVWGGHFLGVATLD